MVNSNMTEYLKLAHFLGQVLGIGYEIALHQTEEGGSKLVTVMNSHVSGREPDYPYSTPAIKSLMNSLCENQDWIINERKKLDNGKEFITSSYFFKDEEGNVLGELSVNFDFWAYNDAMLNLMNLTSQAIPDSIKRPKADGTPDHQAHLTNITHSLTIIANNIRNNYLEENQIEMTNLSQDDKIKIVRMMFESDVFSFRGGVSIAANTLGCSESTIYRYLSKIER